MGLSKNKRPSTGPSHTATATPGFIGDGSSLTGIPESGLVANTATGLTVRRLAHATYSFAVDGGAIGLITPVKTAALPQNAVITNVFINSTTAVTSLGSATVSIGTSAGSSAASLLAATGKASFSANAFVQGIPVPQTASTFVKLSAAGSITLTVAVAALTAGIIEVYVEYYLSAS